MHSQDEARAVESTQRGNFFDYLQFNLPRLTKALFIALVALMGAALLGNVAISAEPFPGGHILMLCLLAGCGAFVVLALVTRVRPWPLGFLFSAAILVVYILGAFAHAPAIGTGFSTEQVALWNLSLILPICYFVLYWALRRGIVVAHPDKRNWHA